MSERLNVRDLVRAREQGQCAVYRENGSWRDELLSEVIRANAEQTPDKVAIVAHHADGQRAEVISYRQLDRLTNRFAGALLELGVKPGEVVSYQLPNWWEFAVLTTACVRIGAVSNPIMPILRKREVRFILDRLQSRVCIVPGTFRGFAHAAMLAEIKGELSTLEHVFVLTDDDEPVPGTERFRPFFCDERWEDKHSLPELDSLRPRADQPTEVMFTSGTTGEPKGVVQDHNSLELSARVMAEGCGLTGDDVVLMASPLGHQTGYLYGVYMPLKYGMKVVYQDIWNPDAVLRLIGDEGVTFTMGSTAFVLDACAAVERNPDVDTSSLRLFFNAGAPIPPRAVEEARTRLKTKLLSGWGMTEIGLCSMTTPSDPDAKVTVSDGVAIEGIRLRIADSDGNTVAAGAEGRLLVQAPSQHLAYLARDDLYDAAFFDGWFETGDLARMETDGYIRITGRSKDLIIRGAENIPVAEVEALLYQHPAVREVAVVAVPDDRLGERACAVVVPAEDTAPVLDELVRHLAELGMAKQFWPERLQIRDALPKTASGKIQKVILRDELRTLS